MRARSIVLLVLAAAGCSRDQTEIPLYGRFEGHASLVDRTLPEHDFIPSGLAHDPVTGTSYLASLRRGTIVAVEREGAVSELVAAGQDGFQSGTALRVDARRRVLWACSAATPHRKGHDPDAGGEKAVYRFDLAGGGLLGRTGMPQTAPLDAFDDLTVAPDGGAYLASRVLRRVYRTDSQASRIDEWSSFDEGDEPAALAIAADGRMLFVATSRGVAVADARSGARYMLAAPSGETLAGIDGLRVQGDRLIALQTAPGAGAARIVRLHIAPGFDRVERIDVLDAGHPLFDGPVAGDVDGVSFLFVANGGRSRYDERWRLRGARGRSDTVLLRLRVD